MAKNQKLHSENKTTGAAMPLFLLTFKSKTMKNEFKHSLIYFAIGCAFILGFVLGVISKVQVTCL